MENKHTKGEWRIQNSGDDEYIDIEADAGRVCSIFIAQETDITPEQSEANAKLICAAPEMFEALLEAIDQLESWNNESEDTFTMKRIREVIRKATE